MRTPISAPRGKEQLVSHLAACARSYSAAQLARSNAIDQASRASGRGTPGTRRSAYSVLQDLSDRVRLAERQLIRAIAEAAETLAPNEIEAVVRRVDSSELPDGALVLVRSTVAVPA
jgi:hypothetical protein